MDSTAATILWKPTEKVTSQANITCFAKFFRETYDPNLGGHYKDLHAASINRPGDFWKAVWEFSGIVGESGNQSFVRGASILDGKWFPDARLNFTEALLKPLKLKDPAFANSIAIVARNEVGQRTVLTRQELHQQVCTVAMFLKSQGVGPGDRVVAVIPNNTEAVIGLLATVAIGAVWSSCSPEFGDDAICDRFGQIEPKVVFTSSECMYGGKSIQPLAKVMRTLHRLPSIHSIVIVGESCLVGSTVATSQAKLFAWSDIAKSQMGSFLFERFPFDHPLCILYSSGTTGVPKCIVHGAGGTLLQHSKEQSLHCDVKSGDMLFYYTTTGWMMWNWLLSGIASEATILLYDGSPFASGPETLWDIARAEGVTHFGASPRYFMTLEKDGYEPGGKAGLDRLRCVLSTGSPLLPESFDWIYRAISPKVLLASISGGTDILSCFVLGNPTLPVVRGQIQCKGLGMDVQVFDEHGAKVVGEPGELVCATPFPSMPIRFWNDPEGKKYRGAYFERFAGVWWHGDWAQEEANGGFVIFGRSDATLNPSGVRIGTSEIYQQVETFPEIAECLATVIRSDGDEQIVLFVKMKNGSMFTRELMSSIRQTIKERCSTRHVPSYMDEAPDLPRTISGKLSEIAVRSAINGSNLGNSGALANPECLEFFLNWKPKS